MATVADLQILVTSDTGQAEAGLGNVNRTVSNLRVDVAAASVAFDRLRDSTTNFLTGAINEAVNFEAEITDAYIAIGGFEGGIEGLTAVVMDLAAALPFSTGEVSGLIEELGYLGVAAEDVEQVAYAVMALAMGIGEDLVPTAEALIGIMKSLGAPMSEVSTYAEQLFQVLNSSALGLTDITNAWQYVGEVVQRAGLSFLDAAALISVLVDRTIPAERAGRALKKAFESLIDPSQELIDILDSLGIEIRDELTGDLLSARDIFFNIWKAWPKLLDDGRDDILKAMDLGEFEGLIRQIFDAGIKTYDNFMSGIKNSMSLWDAVKVKMSTAKSALDTLAETFNNAKIVIGQGLLPAIRLVVDILTPLIEKFISLSPAVTSAVGYILALVAALSGIAAAVGTASALGVIAGAIAVMASPIFIVIAALAALTAAFAWAYQNSETFRGYIDRLVDAFQMVRGFGVDPVTAALRALGIVFPQLYGAVMVAISVWNVLKSVFSSTVDVITSVGSSVAELVTNFLKIGAVRDILAGVLAGIVAFKAINGTVALFGKMVTAVKNLRTILIAARAAVIAFNASLLANPVVLIIAAIVALGVAIYLLYQRYEAVRNVVDPVLNAFKALGSFLLGVLIGAFHAVVAVVGTLIDWFKQVASAVSDFADRMGIIDAVVNAAKSAFESLGSIISNVIGFFKNLGEALSALKDGDISGFLSNLGEAFMNVLSVVGEMATALPRMLLAAFTSIDWGALGSSLMSGIEGALSGLASLGSTIMGWIRSAASSIDWSALLSNAGDIVSGLAGKLGDLTSWALQWVSDAAAAINWSSLIENATDIVTGLSGKLGDLAAWARQWIADAAAAINWSSLLDNATDIVTGLSGKLGDLAAWARQWISDAAAAINWTALVDGATNIVNGLSGKLGDLAAWARKWVSDAASAINWSVLVDGATNIVNGLSGKLGDLGAWAKKWVSDAGSAINWTAMLSAAKNIVNGLSGKLGDLGAWAKKWVSDAASGIDWGVLADFATDITGDIIGKLGDLGGAIKGWLEDAWSKAKSAWDNRPWWLGGSGGGGGETSVDVGVDIGNTTFDGTGLAGKMNDALVNAVNALSGGSLGSAISAWIGRGMEKVAGAIGSYGGIWSGIATAIDTGVGQGIAQLSGASLSTNIAGWFGRAVPQIATSLNTTALGLARQLDTAMQAGLGALSGASLATGIGGWVGRAMTTVGTQLTSIGTAFGVLLDTAFAAGLGQLSGASLAAGIGGWVGRAMTTVSAALTPLGTSFGVLLDTAFTTGLSALSGASLGTGISSWVGRGMTTVSTALTPLGTSFGQLLNSAFVAGITALSGASLGTAMSTWVSNAFTTVKTSITTFVNDTIAVLGGWAQGVQTNVTNTMSTFTQQISQGTSTGKQSHITFVADTIAVMGGWANGIKNNVTETMGTFKQQISQGTSQGKQSFITFGSDATSAVRNAMSNIRSATSSGMNDVVNAIRGGMRDATGAIRNGASDWSGIIRNYAGAMRSAGESVGRAAGEGVAAGLRSSAGSVRAAADTIIAEVDRAMRAKARIASPSKMTTYFGEMLGEGLVVGMDRMVRPIRNQADATAMAAVKQIAGVLENNRVVQMGRTLGQDIAEGIRSGMAGVDVMKNLIGNMRKGLIVNGKTLFGQLGKGTLLPDVKIGDFGGAIINGWERLTEGFYRDIKTGDVMKGIHVEDGSYVNPDFFGGRYRSMPIPASQTTTVYQTNNYTIDVKDMQELNEAVDFVADLDRQRQLVFAG